MSAAARIRVDVWLFRARFVKTRAEASRLVAEGGVRLMHGGQVRRLEKPSADVGAGDALVFAHRGIVRTVRIEGVGTRRGPPAEARRLYRDVEAEGLA